MRSTRRERGQIGEHLACAFLRGLGREILELNYRCRQGEIDVIARDGDAVCFVEVRSRASSAVVGAAESVNAAKRRRLLRAARTWLAEKQTDCSCRFDVIEVEFCGGLGKVRQIIEGAFGEDGEDGWC